LKTRTIALGDITLVNRANKSMLCYIAGLSSSRATIEMLQREDCSVTLLNNCTSSCSHFALKILTERFEWDPFVHGAVPWWPGRAPLIIPDSKWYSRMVVGECISHLAKFGLDYGPYYREEDISL